MVSGKNEIWNLELKWNWFLKPNWGPWDFASKFGTPMSKIKFKRGMIVTSGHPA